MKRMRIMLAIALLCCLILCGCDTLNAGSQTANPSGSNTHVHQFGKWKVVKSATLTETGVQERTCSCGKKETQSIPKIKSDWKVGHYIDDFGEETDDAYAIGTFYGYFSNSATTHSDLTVFVYLDKDTATRVSIRLLEYGSHKATFATHETTKIKIKTDSDYVASYLIGGSSDLIALGEDFVNQILNSKTISCVITTSSKYQTVPSVYHFTINCAGAREMYNLTGS